MTGRLCTATLALALLAGCAGSALPPAPLRAPATLVRPGDRLLLHVDGESSLSDTFVVLAGPAVNLPGIGPVPLRGVPREDVERLLTDEIGKYVRNPVVRARDLLWVGVVGEVTRPGFYAVPADGLVSDALMAAGGMTRDARVGRIRVERDGGEVRDVDETREALSRELTLVQAGVESGDQIVVPRAPDAEHVTRILTLLLAVPVAVYTLTRIY